MPLPKTRSVLTADPARLRYVIYGPPKIGKSTFANGFPSAIFAEAEPALEHLECFKMPITSWSPPDVGSDDSFKSFYAEIKAGKHKFKTIVLDPVDAIYELCRDDVCARLEIDYPREDNYGKDWKAIEEEFRSAMWGLARLPYGVIFISHLKREEVKEELRNRTITVPSMSGQARKIILPIANVIAKMDVDPESLDPVTGVYKDRVLYVRPSPDQEGGSHLSVFPPVVRAHYSALVACLKSKKKGEK